MHAQKQMLVSAACMAVLIFLAFFGAYAGQTFSQPPIPRPLKIEQPPQTKAANPNDSADANQRGTENAPLVVKVLPTPKTAEEAARDEQDRSEKTSSNWWLIKLTGALGLIGGLQLLVFGIQAHRLKQTVDAMQSQSVDMKSYIAESTRAADAMEKVSDSLKFNAEMIVQAVAINRVVADQQRRLGIMQLRPYVSVLIGSGVYPDRKNNLRFDARPILKNTGNSAAHGVKNKIAAAILPVPIPNDFKFRLPKTMGGGSIVAPHQTPFEMMAVVDDFIDDSEVADVMISKGKSLYVWGFVTYKDMFKVTRRITFAQQLSFVGESGKESVRGYYLTRHNRSN
jgi:hypothetical protein